MPILCYQFWELTCLDQVQIPSHSSIAWSSESTYGEGGTPSYWEGSLLHASLSSSFSSSGETILVCHSLTRDCTHTCCVACHSCQIISLSCFALHVLIIVVCTMHVDRVCRNEDEHDIILVMYIIYIKHFTAYPLGHSVCTHKNIL